MQLEDAAGSTSETRSRVVGIKKNLLLSGQFQIDTRTHCIIHSLLNDLVILLAVPERQGCLRHRHQGCPSTAEEEGGDGGQEEN